MRKKKNAETRLAKVEIELAATQSESKSAHEQLRSLKDLIDQLKNITGEDLIQLRKKIKNAIAGFVERIVVYPDGMGNRVIHGDFGKPEISSVHAAIDHLQNIGPDLKIFPTRISYLNKIRSLKAEAADYVRDNTGKDRRAMVIYFKTGGHRMIKWDGDKYTNVVSSLETVKAFLKEGDG